MSIPAKACSKCGVEKPVTDFPFRDKKTDSRKTQCRACFRAYLKQWNRNNPEKFRESRLRYLAVNKHKIQRTRLARYLQREYGITLAEYQRMLLAQGGGCAICDCRPENCPHGRLHVDHDHDTGIVRGLLCHACNIAIGLFGDDTERLDRARAYLVDASIQIERIA